MGPDIPAEVARPRGAELGSFLVRLSTGLSFVAPSAQQDLLDLDHYQRSTRGFVAADLALRVSSSPWLGVGPFAWRSFGSWSGPRGTLNENGTGFGIQAPLAFGGSFATVLVAPRVGFGWVTLDFGGDTTPRGALTLGLEGSLLLFGSHFGLTGGWSWSRTGRMGDLGDHYDMGGGYIGFAGAFHD